MVYQDSQPLSPSALKNNSKSEILLVKIFSLIQSNTSSSGFTNLHTWCMYVCLSYKYICLIGFLHMWSLFLTIYFLSHTTGRLPSPTSVKHSRATLLDLWLKMTESNYFNKIKPGVWTPRKQPRQMALKYGGVSLVRDVIRALWSTIFEMF